MLPTVILALMMAFITSSKSQSHSDWTDGMFPYSSWLEDVVRLNRSDGCKFILCPINGFIAYSPLCQEVPEYPDGFEDDRLSLLGTGLKVLPIGSFTTWGQLVSLRIEMNNELQEIEPRVFFHLSSLTNLSISNNINLGPLDPEVFDGLTNLKELRFVKNNIKTLFHITLATRPFILPSLVSLDISGNPIQNIKRGDFIEMDGSPLISLSLKLCSLFSISPNSFSGLKKLKYLYLDKNNLNSEDLIKLLFPYNDTLELNHIGLSENLLNKNTYKILEIMSYSNISSIDLSDNHFDVLSSTFFPLMPNVEKIDLSGVSAYDVEIGTFDSTVLPNLKHLYFSRNQLPGFVPGLALPDLVELDLSGNGCLDCDVSPLFKIIEHEMQSMKMLQILNLSKNNIYHISRFMFFGLESLKVIYLSNCSIFSIEDYSFESFFSLEHLDLSLNKFIKTDKITGNTFSGLVNLSSLRLDSCSITSLPNPDVFSRLNNLKYLTLRDNVLITLNPMIFLPLTKLRRLDLSDNELLPWNSRIFTSNYALERLSVESNQLYKFTSEMMSDFGIVEYMNLRDNPIMCNCDLVHSVLNANKGRSKNVFGFNDSAIKCVSPRNWSHLEALKFIKANSKNFICMHWGTYAAIIAICVLFILLICSVGMYYLRWYFRYWLFLIKQSWRASFPKRKIIATTSKYKYDAFVSYSHEDRNFVIRMVAMLENYDPYYRLCVFERDFNAGEVICESVVDCLNVSRKTILILTDSFARSQWCQWELQMAHHRRFFFKSEGKDSLILIKLGDIMDAHLTPTLRYLMKTRIYLQWYNDPKRQKVFWQKLREALKSNVEEDMNV